MVKTSQVYVHRPCYPTHTVWVGVVSAARRYSATRHNLTIHDNRGEIVPLLEYIVGRNSGRYLASDPSMYRMRRGNKRNRQLVTAFSADSMGAFPPRLQQQQRQQQETSTLSYHQLSTFQCQPQPLHISPSPNISPYPTEIPRMSHPTHYINTNSQGNIQPQDNILKIQELKRLMYKYPQYHSNPDLVLKCATLSSFNGDNTLLDEWLERFRTVDAITNTEF
jgi:hypothetical protein